MSTADGQKRLLDGIGKFNLVHIYKYFLPKTCVRIECLAYRLSNIFSDTGDDYDARGRLIENIPTTACLLEPGITWQ